MRGGLSAPSYLTNALDSQSAPTDQNPSSHPGLSLLASHSFTTHGDPQVRRWNNYASLLPHVYGFKTSHLSQYLSSAELLPIDRQNRLGCCTTATGREISRFPAHPGFQIPRFTLPHSYQVTQVVFLTAYLVRHHIDYVCAITTSQMKCNLQVIYMQFNELQSTE